MLTEFDIYVAFRKAQSNALNRPFRLPKDWDKHFNDKMTPEQRESLRKMSRYLLTYWTNIDINRYFKYAFEVKKTFTYKDFFNEQFIKYYIHKDKNLKRNVDEFKKNSIDKAKWLKNYLTENNISSLKEYSNINCNYISLPIEHFLKGYINIHLLTYLIIKKYLKVSDENSIYLTDYMPLMRNIKQEIYENSLFFEQIDKKLMRQNINK